MLSAYFLSFLCAFVCFAAAGIDPYEVLGVPRDADERTIKSQYRQLSKQYHPDKNPSPEAQEKFIEVGEAYSILNDPQKRQNYDNFGDPEGQKQHMGGHDDIFNQFFGGAFGGQHHQQQRQRRGGDTQVTMSLGLSDFFLGRDVDFSLEMQNICDSCTGSGSADGKKKKCPHCNGQGVITQTVQFGPMIQRVQSHCDHCQGSGHVTANKCKTCRGGGTVRAARQYKVFVTPGTPRNHIHVLEGEGDQSPDWVPGHLRLRFVEKQEENWGFRRVGDNLYRTEVLTAKEASLGGWERHIKLFDDEVVGLKRAEGESIIDGQVDVIEGHGMPSMSNHDEYGNLYVEYRVLPIGKVGSVSKNQKDEL